MEVPLPDRCSQDHDGDDADSQERECKQRQQRRPHDCVIFAAGHLLHEQPPNAQQTDAAVREPIALPYDDHLRTATIAPVRAGPVARIAAA